MVNMILLKMVDKLKEVKLCGKNFIAMRKNNLLFKAFATFAIGLAMTSCTDKMVEEILPEEQSKDALPESFIAILPQSTDTKTTFTPMPGKNDIKVAWEEGDKITISPAHLSSNANEYELTSSTESKGVFKKVKGPNVQTYTWGIYYPGDKIKSDIDFLNFSYSGQVQKKSAPTAHMDKYNAMMLWMDGSGTMADNPTLDFREADRSSCIHFELGGQTFVNPKSISLIYVNANGFVEPLFHENNKYIKGFYYDGSNSYNGLQTTAILTLGLDGYGTETSLDAYLMTSNYTEIPGNGYFLVKVKCEGTSYFCRVKSTQLTLSGGKVMNIASKGRWYEDNVPYDDTEYPFDGEVIACHEPHPTTGPDLIIMGDGFIAEDIENGTYVTIMKQAINEFFTIQPFNKFQDKFNFYYVNAVSPQRLNPSEVPWNGAVGSGCITKFNTVLQNNTTFIYGNHDLIKEYAMKALRTNAEERIKNATIVVMVNTPSHAGTCWNFYPNNPTTDYGEAMAIAYCALGVNPADRQQLMYHEICGHGFGKLDDEYYFGGLFPNLGNTDYFEAMKKDHAAGLWRNADYYVDEELKTKYSVYGTWENTSSTNVYWKDLFGTENDYETKESLGVFKGACTFAEGFCRPTENGLKSIMHYNTGCFNAPSRRQILYRIQKLLGATYAFGSKDELNNFLTWDDANFVYPAEGQTRANYVEKVYPIDPPVWVKGSWVDGHFVEADVIE